MVTQDQSKPTIPSGHESHGVHVCHRCGWPFPKPHPSARHRRAHKKICGTIEGYTNLIDSGVVSDDEQHRDEDKEKTPSPKIEKKSIKESGGGGGERSGRSDDDLFSDAVTEFSDNGTSPGVEDRSAGNRDSGKSLDRGLLSSFKDGENGGTNEVSDSSMEISKVNGSPKASETMDTLVEKILETEITNVCGSTEAKLELPEADGKRLDCLVKDGQSDESHSHKVESIDVVETGKGKVQETRTSETIEQAVPTTITKEAQASEMIETTPETVISLIEAEVSVTMGLPGEDDNAEQQNLDKLSDSAIAEKLEAATAAGISQEIKHEKFESDHEHVSEVVQESVVDNGAEEIREEIKHAEFKLDHEHAPEVVKEPEVDQSEEIKHEKFESDHEHAPEVVNESEIDQRAKGVSEEIKHGKFEYDHERASEVVSEPETDQSISVLNEKEDLGAPKSEQCSKEETQEVNKPDTVLTQKEDLGAPNFKKCSKENTQEVSKEPDSVLTEKEELGAPNSENCSKEHTKEAIEELKVGNNSNVVADISTKNITLEEADKPVDDLQPASDNSVAIDDTCTITNCKNASGVVCEPTVEGGKGKLMNNQDSGVDLLVDSSSHNSLEGNWGSVSVLSTASIDAETLHMIDKSKVNSKKSVAAADVCEAPSFMTLEEPKGEVVDQKSAAACSSEVQDSQQQPKAEAPQAGWFPTLTNIGKESEGRKRNEEVIARVTNRSTGKHSTPLKNLLGQAKSPNPKQAATLVQKDEAATERPSLPSEDPAVNQDSSPPRLIDDGKKVRKKVKGIGSWVPFVCCSSVNVVN